MWFATTTQGPVKLAEIIKATGFQRAIILQDVGQPVACPDPGIIIAFSLGCLVAKPGQRAGENPAVHGGGGRHDAGAGWLVAVCVAEISPAFRQA